MRKSPFGSSGTVKLVLRSTNGAVASQQPLSKLWLAVCLMPSPPQQQAWSLHLDATVRHFGERPRPPMVLLHLAPPHDVRA